MNRQGSTVDPMKSFVWEYTSKHRIDDLSDLLTYIKLCYSILKCILQIILRKENSCPAVAHSEYSCPAVAHSEYFCPAVAHSEYSCPAVAHSEYSCPAVAHMNTLVLL